MKLKTITGGYSLVEVLVAVAILMLAIVSPMTIAVKSIQSAQYVHQQNTAIFLAQEGISVANAIRDNNGLSYLNGDTTDPWEFPDYDGLAPCFDLEGCNFDVSDPLSLNETVEVTACGEDGESCRLYFDESAGQAVYHVNGTAGTESPFIRRIYMVHNADEVQVVSTVEWESKLLNSVQEVSVTGSFFNIYKLFN